MTSNLSSERAGVAAPSGAETFARYGLAASAVAFAVVLVVAVLLTPFDVGAEGREYVQGVADDLDALGPVLWLWPIATFLGIPAVLAVGRVARSRAPALGLAGLILAFGIAIPIGIDWDELSYASLKAGLDVDTTTTLLDSVESNLPSSVFAWAWLAGLVGLILVGVAVLRGRSAPVWAGVALIVAPVAIPLTWFSGSSIALAAAWVVLGVGFVGCALTLVREPADPPAPSPTG